MVGLLIRFEDELSYCPETPDTIQLLEITTPSGKKVSINPYKTLPVEQSEEPK